MRIQDANIGTHQVMRKGGVKKPQEPDWLAEEVKRDIRAQDQERHREPAPDKWSETEQAVLRQIANDRVLCSAIQLHYFDAPCAFEEGISDEEFADLVGGVFIGMLRLIAGEDARERFLQDLLRGIAARRQTGSDQAGQARP